jgi:hypothetical protein
MTRAGQAAVAVTTRALILVLAAIAVHSSVAEAERITVALNQGGPEWFSRTIHLPGRGDFEVRVDPEKLPSGDIIGWNVELYERIKPGVVAGNLLEPKGNWHGLQPFMVVPRDVQERRWRSQVITVTGLRCSIEVLDGEIRPSAERDGEMFFVSLRLAIEITQQTQRPRTKATPSR